VNFDGAMENAAEIVVLPVETGAES